MTPDEYATKIMAEYNQESKAALANFRKTRPQWINDVPSIIVEVVERAFCAGYIMGAVRLGRKEQR